MSIKDKLKAGFEYELRFRVPDSKGTHERFIIDTSKFNHKVKQKAEKHT